MVVGSTIIFWKRRSNAPSFSIDLRYSSSVVAPMHCNSPRERAGFIMLAASIVPAWFPAPTKVWISSIKTMMSGFALSSAMMLFMRSSNCPRYLVPATTLVMSSVMRRLLNKVLDTLRSLMRCANPSTIALFPTPGSPISTGLFFLRRERI